MAPLVPPSPIIYHSGDLAIRLSSGELRFCGRVDRQVKVRGFRVELEAVELVLRSFEPKLIQLAALVEHSERGGELVAYINGAAAPYLNSTCSLTTLLASISGLSINLKQR